MGELDLTVLTSIEQVAAADWNAMSGARAFVDHPWLRFTEAALANYEPRYVLLRRGGRLEAAAVCSVDRRFANPALQRRAGSTSSIAYSWTPSSTCSRTRSNLDGTRSARLV